MPTKKPKIFLVHYAGGSAYSFEFLKPELKAFEAVALELPGRGKRLKEPLIENFEAAVNDIYMRIVATITPGRDLIYGHSLGAILSFYVTAKLEKADKAPRFLIVSGNNGPGVAKTIIRHTLSAEDLNVELRKLGGMPDEILDNEELYLFFEPVLRADFKLFETYDFGDVPIIKTPIKAVMGSNEEGAELIDNWQFFSSSCTESFVLSGNHFFIHDHPKALAEIIEAQ